MFKRLAICLALTGAPFAVAAQSVQDQIVTQLERQGFEGIALNRTWLGRVRVVAMRDDLRRELVFNPQTGEILRDYWFSVDDDVTEHRPRLVNPDNGNAGSGNTYVDDGEDDDDDRDEDDDHDDDDDHDEDDDAREDDD